MNHIQSFLESTETLRTVARAALTVPPASCGAETPIRSSRPGELRTQTCPLARGKPLRATSLRFTLANLGTPAEVSPRAERTVEVRFSAWPADQAHRTGAIGPGRRPRRAAEVVSLTVTRLRRRRARGAPLPF